MYPSNALSQQSTYPTPFGGFALPIQRPQQQQPPTGSSQLGFPSALYPQGPHHYRQSSLPTSSPDVAHVTLTASQGAALLDLGKGLPLHAVPQTTKLYIVEFKAGRTDLFYASDPSQPLSKGELVIVEADRGKDLGKVVNDSISLAEVKKFQEQQAELAFLANQAGLGNQGGGNGGGGGQGGQGVVNGVTVRGLTKEIMPKRIYSKAQPLDAQ